MHTETDTTLLIAYPSCLFSCLFLRLMLNYTGKVCDPMNRSMYMMVSIPACSLETVYEPPIILGVFETKELAREAWKARPKEYRDIKAKTVHTYVETMICEGDEVPENIWLWALYYVEESPGGHLFISCYPYNCGFLPSYEAFEQEYTNLKSKKPIMRQEFCQRWGYRLYAENPHIIAQFEPNKLTRYTVPLTYTQHFDSEETP